MIVYKSILKIIKRNILYVLPALFALVIMLPFIGEKYSEITGYNFDIAYYGDENSATFEEKSLLKYLDKYNIKKLKIGRDDLEMLFLLDEYDLLIDFEKPVGSADRIRYKNSILQIESEQFSGYLNEYEDYNKAAEIMAHEIEASTVKESSSTSKEAVFSMLLYQLSVVLLVIGIKVLKSMYDEDFSKRRIIGGLNENRYYVSMIMALVTALIISALYSIGFVAIFYEITWHDFIFSFINYLGFGTAIISLATLIAKVAKENYVAYGLANTISLGLAFISGTFGNGDLVNRKMLSVAKLFPEYYALVNAQSMDFNVEFWKNFGIMILFAAAYYAANIYIGKMRARGND